MAAPVPPVTIAPPLWRRIGAPSLDAYARPASASRYAVIGS